VWIDFQVRDYDYNLGQLVSVTKEGLIAKPPPVKKGKVSIPAEQSEILEFTSAEKIVDFEKEIELFRKMLAPGGTPPILFVEAPSGMGKTWLLYRYLHMCRGEGLRTSYVDFRGGFFRDPQTIVDSITRQVDIGWRGMSVYELRGVLRSLAETEKERNIVFLFDTVDEAQEIEQWLVENLLVPIKDGRLQNLRLVAAGQKSPRLVHEEEWLGMVEHRLRLPLWEVKHIRQFGEANGLNIDQNTALLIHTGTKGFPQTCSLFIKNLLMELRYG